MWIFWWSWFVIHVAKILAVFCPFFTFLSVPSIFGFSDWYPNKAHAGAIGPSGPVSVSLLSSFRNSKFLSQK